MVVIKKEQPKKSKEWGLCTKIAFGIVVALLVILFLSIVISWWYMGSLPAERVEMPIQESREKKYPTIGDTIKRDNYEVTLMKYLKNYVNEKYYDDPHSLYYNTSFIHFEYEVKVLDLSKEPLGSLFIGQFRPFLFDTVREKLYSPVPDYDIWTSGGGLDVDAGRGDGSVYLNKKDKLTGLYTRTGLSEINYPVKVIITSDCSEGDFDTLPEINAIEQGEKCPITYVFTVY